MLEPVVTCMNFENNMEEDSMLVKGEPERPLNFFIPLVGI